MLLLTQRSLNPYSNGLLSETLTESVLRFPHFSHLKMNTLSQRPKQTNSLFFANVPIKNEKMNICETFL